MSATNTIKVKQGDYGPSATIYITVTDPDGTITSLGGYNMRLLVWGPDILHPIIDGACVFLNGMTCYYVPVLADTLNVGNYSWELELNSTRLSTVTGAFIIEPSPSH